LSQKNLIEESLIVLKHIVKKFKDQSVILVGHSMGGSIATKLTDLISREYKDENWAANIKGLFVIDVVEGSAMDALPFMENFIATKPKSFGTL
jgi:protein phosphatase methylesterase 1